MVTIVTDVHVKDGKVGDWDEIMQERMAAARQQPGWVAGQLLQPTGDPQKRRIIGTWRTRDDWQAWHRDPKFAQTRRQLDELVRGPEMHEWHEVVELEVRTAQGRQEKASAGSRREKSSGRSREPRKRGAKRASAR